MTHRENVVAPADLKLWRTSCTMRYGVKGKRSSSARSTIAALREVSEFASSELRDDESFQGRAGILHAFPEAVVSEAFRGVVEGQAASDRVRGLD
jgi:hypothetical protein